MGHLKEGSLHFQFFLMYLFTLAMYAYKGYDMIYGNFYYSKLVNFFILQAYDEV